MVSLAINAFISSFINYLDTQFGHFSTFVAIVISILVSLGIITVLFAMIFKFLPDANLKWRDTWKGAIFTALLFSVGKDLIGFYIGNSQTANLYEAAGSVMVIMVWVFFASTIFLFGAVFTYEQTKMNEGEVPPMGYAVKTIHKEIEVSSEGDDDQKP